MRKYFFLVIVIICCCGWSPVDYVPAYKTLRSDIVVQLNDLFGREVSVESISGILVNQIELNNVKIAKDKKVKDGTIISSKKIIINYSPFKLAASRGNITAAISKITIIEPEILVERSINDEWNMAKLIPKTRSVDDSGVERPLPISATISILNGRGIYMDHMGFGEPLEGKAFVSKIRDLNGDIKLSGSRVNVAINATSVIDRSVAYARATGNVNVKNGKYYFVVNARNVDIEKWGHYTLNIPDFRPHSGYSDMKLTMTNPPPRKKGQPILFDGKFSIRDGKATVFGQEVRNIKGNINVHDEDAGFKDLSGMLKDVPLTLNGRLYDFTIANYDMKLSFPKIDWQKIKQAFPAVSGIDYSGMVSGIVGISGNYGHPLFSGTVYADGKLLGQRLSGNLYFSSDGPVLKIGSDNISAFGGTLFAESIFDFTPAIPNLDIHVSSESIDLSGALMLPNIQNTASLNANIKGSLDRLEISGNAATKNNGKIAAFGTFEAGTTRIRIYGSALDLDIQPISKFNADLIINSGSMEITSARFDAGDSSASVKGRILSDGMMDCIFLASSAEASDLKVLNYFLPKELLPVSGILDLNLAVKGKFDPDKGIDWTKIGLLGSISLKDGLLLYEKIRELNISLDWSQNKLYFKRSAIRTVHSNLSWSGTMEPSAGKINFDIAGKLDISNLKPFTLKYGRLFGSADITCHIEGKAANPSFDLDFDASTLRFNEVILDHITGRVIYDGMNLFFAKPLDLMQEDDEYLLSGSMILSKKQSLSLRLDVIKGDLSTAVSLFDDVSLELGKKQIMGQFIKEKPVMVNLSKLKYPDKPLKILYKSDGPGSQVDEVRRAQADTSSLIKEKVQKVKRRVDGRFSGFMEMKGGLSDLSGQLFFTLSGGTWESYTFDEALIKGRLENGTFEAESVYVKKGDGTLSAFGSYNPSTSASIEISARNMPVDFLSLFIGGGKPFKGKFNMDAYIRGPVAALRGSALIEAGKVNIGGVGLDNISSTIDLRNATLYFRKLELSTADKKASISGVLPLEKEGIFMNITTEGESLGLLTIASKDISWIGGSGRGSLNITGSLANPVFNGRMAIENAAVGLEIIGSSLESVNARIDITENVISISSEGLSAKWVGPWTQGAVNKVRLFGNVDLNGLFTKERAVLFDLRLKDGDFLVDFPNLYRGDLSVKSFSLAGPLSLAPGSTAAPKLSGIFNLSNGMIILPDMTKKNKLPPLGLNMVLNIEKNSYVVAGDLKNLISTDLSNLLLNLEIEGNNIVVGGDLENPRITGKTTFKRGTVNLLNREFSLMSEDRQKDLYGSDLEKVKENSAEFSASNLPKLTLAAEVKVKNTVRVAEAAIPGEPPKTPTYVTENVIIISRITGIPFSTDPERGIKLSFDSFVEDASKQPPELIAGKYNEEQIKVILLPDFIKGPLGISEKGVLEVDAKDVVVDYMNSRLNAYLLRNMERNLAKSLDLESLTLEYNFGKDLRNMMPSSAPPDVGPNPTPETMYGIGAVKGFFDRFFIDVRYSQAVQEQALINNAYLNYQITYKLSPILSVVYYREPFSFLEEESNYYKVTLKAGYQL